MNKKKLRGFTLIELIVVLAIVAALAAILIPTMIGYTRQARAQTAIANAKNVYSGAALALLDMHTNDEEVMLAGDSGVFMGANSTVAQTSSGTQIDISKFMGEDFSGYYGFKISADGNSVEYAVWSSKPINATQVLARSEERFSRPVHRQLPCGVRNKKSKGLRKNKYLRRAELLCQTVRYGLDCG